MTAAATTRPRVIIVGLGPATADLIPKAAQDALARSDRRFVRTARHPAATAVPGAVAFDDVYETAARLDAVYETIVERLVDEAAGAGEIVYAVPGSPFIAERTVELLRSDPRVDVDIIVAPSFLDLAWQALGIDPVASGVRVIDGHRFATEAAGERGPMLVAQVDSRAVLSDIKLSAEPPAATSVIVLQRLGLPTAAIRPVAWNELDRSVDPDHLTALFVPTLAPPVAHEVVAAAEVTRTLREQCPWDREQTHQSLMPYLLEEAYEVVEAIQHVADGVTRGYENLEEELGDLLYQVLFHATLAAEAGQFTLADVARGLHDKLVRRHPHVFGDVTVGNADDVIKNWEERKREEKGRVGVFDGVPPSLPALLYAGKLQARAAASGFARLAVGDEVDGAVRAALDGVPGGSAEAGIGALLFAVVGVARENEVDPEAALRRAANQFRRHVEATPTGEKESSTDG